DALPISSMHMGARIALVSGGTGAIGRVICGRFAEDGFRVVANCHPSDAANGGAGEREVRARNVDIALYPVDVSDHETTRAGIERIESEIGPIDVLVNAAG